MARTFKLVLCCICLTATAVEYGEERAGGVYLLRPGGAFHQDEVHAPAGERWWGLFQQEEEFVLRPVTIQLGKGFDVVTDGGRGVNDKPELHTGICVEVKGIEDKPLFLVYGIEGLQPGPVTTLLSERKFLHPGESLYYWNEGTERFRVSAYGCISASTRGVIKGYELYTSHGCSLVHHERVAVGEAPTLIWIGDLNRDGHADVLADITYHYNLTEWALFLSTGKDSDACLEKVAVFRTTGC